VGYGADRFTVWGEFTQHVPPTVTDAWMELENGDGSYLPLDDWPSQTSGRQRVRVISWEQRFPYSGSVLVGYQPVSSSPGTFAGRIEWTILVGVTLIRRQENYVEQHYTVVGGVPVPQPTFGIIAGPFTRHDNGIGGALVLGLDAAVPLTRRLSVVPNVRVDLRAANWARARAGAGLQWTF
jgi:hypothetical protein